MLITLGIIGIVSLTTIPVINVIQEKHFHAKWKECYSILNNAFLMVASENPNMVVSEEKSYDMTREFVDTMLSKLKVVDTCGISKDWDDEICDNYYYINSRKKFPWAGIGNIYSVYYSLAGDRIAGYDFDLKAALLANGAVIHFGGLHSGYTILVDVNSAAKGPNVLGRDVYAMSLTVPKYPAAWIAYSKLIIVEDIKVLPLGAVGTIGQTDGSYGSSGCSKYIGSASASYVYSAAGAGCSYKYLSE